MKLPEIHSKLYSTAEVAAFLHVSLATVRKYIRDKRIEAIQLRQGFRVSPEALAKFIRERRAA